MSALFPSSKPRSSNTSATRRKQDSDNTENFAQVWQKVNNIEENVRVLNNKNDGKFTGAEIERVIKKRTEDSEYFSIAASVAMS
jgi:hypothetical protein